MRFARPATSALLVGLTIAVGGCGSSTETPATFGTNADAICASFDRVADRVEGLSEHPVGDFVHREGLEIGGLVTAGRRALDELRRLHPPSIYAEPFDDYLEVSRLRLELAARSGRAYANNDPITAELLRRQGIKLKDLQQRAAKKIRFKRCGQD
jgi:hypothetical protein